MMNIFKLFLVLSLSLGFGFAGQSQSGAEATEISTEKGELKSSSIDSLISFKKCSDIQYL